MEVQSYHASCVTNFCSQYRGLRPEPTNNEREKNQQNNFARKCCHRITTRT